MTNASQVSIASAAPPDHVFPTLTDSHLERIVKLGRCRSVRRDEVLVTEGQRQAPFFVVTTGELRIVRPTGGSGEALVGTLRSGQFTGELNMFSNRRAHADSREGRRRGDRTGSRARPVARPG